MSGLTKEASEEVTRVFQLAPFISELGLGLKSIESGQCETTLKLERRHLQQDGFVHAGVQAAVADHTAGTAAATLIDPRNELVLTAEFKINLLRTAKGDVLRCRAKVLKGGSQLTVVESEVFCENSGQTKLVSKATVTIAIVGKNRK